MSYLEIITLYITKLVYLLTTAAYIAFTISIVAPNLFYSFISTVRKLMSKIINILNSVVFKRILLIFFFGLKQISLE